MSFEKFRILVWKNWTIQRRHYKGLIFEIFFPVALVILFTFTRKLYGEGELESVLFAHEENQRPSNSCAIVYDYVPSKIVFSPSSPWIDEFLKSVFKSDETFEIESFQNAAMLDDYLEGTSINSVSVFGIEFEDSLLNSITRPTVLKYAIRLPELYYSDLHSCFHRVQNDLEKGFLGLFGTTGIPDINLKSFHYYQSLQDSLTEVMKVLLPIILIFSIFYAANNIIKNVAIERENQLKETMRIMGLSNTLHWAAWFVTCFAVLVIAYSLVTVFMKFKIIAGQALLEHSDMFLIWILFLFYSMAVITFCFLMSVIFQKATTAGNVGTIIFFLTFVIYNQFRENFKALGYGVKFLYCLPLNTGLSQAISIILDYEQTTEGLQFSNFASRDNNEGFSVADVIFALVVASAIHILLMIYIEQVFTGSIGVAKPWYFPISPIIRLFKNSQTKDFAIKQKQTLSSDDFEKDPVNLKPGIRIAEISKNFGRATVVDQLSLNMYEGQITVLLGHNGAGKTTTMNMLTGMFSPTSGTAYINGHDIVTETIEARNSLGLCPQHNILIDDLTVKEHIILFCRLKGVRDQKEIDKEISKFGDLLDFNDKINALSKTLSGGQKRKLAIGVALCGNSKIVMLDEPTSGLDAGARRSLWNLLIEEKKERTILLTTHYMDEADVLGDRIAIMNEGRLQTVGSPFFLKKRFGSGYKLICVKDRGCNVNEILNLLREFTPDVQLESNAQTEAVFIINEEYISVFHKMFKKIENESARLKISSFGCSLTTLEEVFIKIGAQHDEQSGLVKNQDFEFNDFLPSRKVNGLKLVFYQVYAMMLKQFHYTRRNFYAFGWLILITAFLMYAFLVAPIEFPGYDYLELQSNEISLSALNATITAVGHDGSNSGIATNYKSFFGGKDELVEIDESVDDFLFRKFKTDTNAEKTHLLAATIMEDEIVGWFSSYRRSIFLRSLNLNLIHRSVLKNIAGAEYDILLTNKPFNVERETTIAPETTEGEVELTKEEEMSLDATITNFILIFLMFYLVLIYWPSIFIGIKVKERVTRSKLLQFISGTNRFIYWITSFFIDFVILMIVIYVIVGIVGLNQRPYFRTGEQLGTLMILFAFYGFSTMPFIYLLSFLFEKPSTAEAIVRVCGLVFGIIYVVYALLKFLVGHELSANIIYWIFMLFAPFTILDCFRKISYGSYNVDPDSGAFNFNESIGVGANILMMLASGVLFMSLCLLKDYLVIDRLFYKIFRRRQNKSGLSNMDDDVKIEADRVKSMTRSQLRDGNLVLKGLSKRYKEVLAVNQLHLGVNNAECFGLLGINGAGKTSTFKMMTGDELISSGDVWIRGKSMKNEMIGAQRTISYCPQFDALMFEISGRESLKIFSLIRGIPINEIEDINVKLATELGFHMHLDKQVEAYSGGNKRKLSTSLSLLGDPNLIFLDEPTTGIDPYSKRQLWTIINKTRNSGKSVVLTSHSMEECEALCTRIAIMVSGEFKCLGSPQHLKNKFSKGYILSIKMDRDDEALLYDIQNRVHHMFPAAQLKEKYMELLTFHITSASLKWSEVFEKMSEIKSAVAIDFTITQMSLEQVFLHFTRKGQHEITFGNGNESLL